MKDGKEHLVEALVQITVASKTYVEKDQELLQKVLLTAFHAILK